MEREILHSLTPKKIREKLGLVIVDADWPFNVSDFIEQRRKEIKEYKRKEVEEKEKK